MQKLIQIILFCLTLSGAFWLCSGESQANSPAAARCILIVSENVPEEAAFLELLIPMSQEDPYYRNFNQTACDETGLTSSAPIVSYLDKDGYISYSFHMEHAVSDMKLETWGNGQEGYHSCGFGEGAYAGSQTHLEYIQRNYRTIKAALLDAEGNILVVSDAASIRPGHSGYLTGSISFDCATGRLTPDIYKGYLFAAVLLLAMVLLIIPVSLRARALFTSTVETAVSMAFGIRPRPTIFLVNIISNLMFNLLLILCTTIYRIPYLVFVTAGEIAVVAGEYLVYRRMFQSYGRIRLLAFAFTANLASLVLGTGLNYILSELGFYELSRLL